MILVISSEVDNHAMEVLRRLVDMRVPATLLDLSQFPQGMHLAIDYDPYQISPVLSWDETDLDLDTCSVIWWRRPQPFDLHAEITDSVDRSFAYTECQAAISGLWRMLDAFWVNHPRLEEEASLKASQLKIAREVGLEVPVTLTTNDPGRARAFVDTFGARSTIYKAFSGTEEAWRETRVLRSEEIALLDNVGYAPVIFQECVPALFDLRVTVVGQEIFAAAIHAQDSTYEFDYRMDMERAQVEEIELPSNLSNRIIAFMERLGLTYGAIDMRLTPDQRYVFLEINPSGQWLFIERRTGQAITEAFVDLLVEHDM